MRRVALACLCLGVAIAPVRGQVKNTQEGEAFFGIVGQDDTQNLTGVKLSPVGLNIGIIVQPLFNNRRLSIAQQISFVPVILYERQTSIFGEPVVGRSKPLILNNLWARLSTDEPEATGKNVYFAGAGVSFAISTPRDGTKVTPMMGVGMRRWFVRQSGVEISLQCGLQRIGRTTCTLPIISAWPFS